MRRKGGGRKPRRKTRELSKKARKGRARERAEEERGKGGRGKKEGDGWREREGPKVRTTREAAGHNFISTRKAQGSKGSVGLGNGAHPPL